MQPRNRALPSAEVAPRAVLPLTADGIWLQVNGAVPAAARAGLFLDRDGVIVEDTGYLSTPSAVRLLPGAAALMRRANQAGIAVAVVTNQSGIARRLFGWDEFAAVEAEIERQLLADGAAIDGICACPFHPEFGDADPASTARWRKPGPGMIEALAAALWIDRQRAWIVGDKPGDIEAARNAGLAGAVLLPPGGDHAARDRALGLGGTDFSVRVTGELNRIPAILHELFDAPGSAE
jgi:D-glycero-D-manno-heptose 1,7-bisphosphate phosphatase